MSDFGFYDEDGAIGLGETSAGSPFIAYRPRLEEQGLEEVVRSGQRTHLVRERDDRYARAIGHAPRVARVSDLRHRFGHASCEVSTPIGSRRSRGRDLPTLRSDGSAGGQESP